MVAEIIDGRAFASNIRDDIKANIEKTGLKVGLAVILVGNDPASQVYVRNKEKAAIECGISSKTIKLDEFISQKELIDNINKLNDDPDVNAILVQLPLPKHISENVVINAISPTKDVDGFHILNTGLVATGQEGTVPCTPLGCKLMIKEVIGDLTGKNAVIVGRSNIVGKPMANLLLKEDCTVTICHSKTKNIAEICKQADILVSAVGMPNLIKKDWVKKGAVVIDVGINRITDESTKSGYKLVGDVDFDDVKEVAGYITPVPGGVGPMTIACLLLNTFQIAFKKDFRNKKSKP